MLEYRVGDGDGGFDFIELNPRNWQSLHLDLLAGVDFPRLQMAWFEGQPRTSPPIYRTVTCGDLWPVELIRMLEIRSEEHTSELQSLMRTSYAVFCLQKIITLNTNT